MTVQVILKATKGPLEGEVFVFDGLASCTIGRGHDSGVWVPSDRSVSRRHCQLTVDPPEAWVLDLDSLNGTYVNGQLIGRRLRDAEGEAEAGQPRSPHALKEGDEIEVGTNVFEVHLCADTGEPAPAERDESGISQPALCS